MLTCEEKTQSYMSNEFVVWLPESHLRSMMFLNVEENIYCFCFKHTYEFFGRNVTVLVEQQQNYCSQVLQPAFIHLKETLRWLNTVLQDYRHHVSVLRYRTLRTTSRSGQMFLANWMSIMSENCFLKRTGNESSKLHAFIQFAFTLVIFCVVPRFMLYYWKILARWYVIHPTERVPTLKCVGWRKS